MSALESWNRRARAWAVLQEPLHAPVYSAVLALARIGSQSRVLDVGCGSGVFLTAAAAAGAVAHGCDPADAMLEIARARLPAADLRTAALPALPWPAASFDAVTAFHVVQHMPDPVAGMHELVRVARPGGRIALATWGRAARCPIEPLLRQVARGFDPFAFGRIGQLETLALAVGLEPEHAHTIACPFRYPDLEAASRGLQVETREAEAELRRFRRPDGSVEIENEFRFVVARRRAT